MKEKQNCNNCLNQNDIYNCQINSSELAYSAEEYLGELYQVILSCSNERLPMKGCLFYKIVGSANITNG